MSAPTRLANPKIMKMPNTSAHWTLRLAIVALFCASSQTGLAQQAEEEREAPATPNGETEAPATSVAPELPPPPPPTPPTPTRELECQDGRDDDGDGMVDCGDADCFEHVRCQFGGATEGNDERCSDWLDNDGDGAIDCADDDCSSAGVSVCSGSADGHQAEAHTETQTPEQQADPPLMSGELTGADLIGRGEDDAGEMNDYTCSDGIDNDGDGRVDCEDYGCRFDPQVTVCTASPGFRVSLVAGVGASYDLEAEDSGEAADVSFRRLQLRLLGAIPYINESFFLLSMRLERSVRLTFAHFQVPIGDNGHFFALNTGSGSLTTTLIVSAAKQLLLDPAFYLVNAFEQGNGAALEMGGPLTRSGSIQYRAFLAGGSGRSNGNVGGRFFPDDNENFTYTAGAQFTFNIIGHFNRFDSPMLYDVAPVGLAVMLGAKWDQRALERYPAANALVQFKHSYFLIRAENYFKYTLDFGGSVQNAFNVQAAILLWPRHLLLGADFGMYQADDFSELPIGSDQDQPQDQLQFRVAMHWFWFRNIGLLSLMYTENHTQGRVNREDPSQRLEDEIERNIRLEAQFRF